MGCGRCLTCTFSLKISSLLIYPLVTQTYCPIFQEDHHIGISTALLVAIMPVMFFFNFLYYTDLGSVFYVLFSYACMLYDRPLLSGVAGWMAVVFRQTNIAWIAWIAATDVLRCVRNANFSDKVMSISVGQELFTSISSLPRYLVPITKRLWLHLRKFIMVSSRLLQIDIINL